MNRFQLAPLHLGIVTEAFGAEKEKLRDGATNEPTVFSELGMYFQQGRKVGRCRLTSG
jgi:hypothetical protein